MLQTYCYKTIAKQGVSDVLLKDDGKVRYYWITVQSRLDKWQFSITVCRCDYNCSCGVSLWIKWHSWGPTSRQTSKLQAAVAVLEIVSFSVVRWTSGRVLYRPSPNPIIQRCFGRRLFSLVLVLLQQDGTEREGRIERERERERNVESRR